MRRLPWLCLFGLLAGLLLPVALSDEPMPNSPAPPAGLPAPLVSAATTLFDQGLADPRGGDYRQVSVGVGSVWPGDGGVVRTHGWVLPSAAAGPRSAVCWNGLVYPVVSVYGPADLNADVSALIKADADVRAARAKANPAEPYDRFIQAADTERVSLSETSFLPLKGCLLLRLGEGELARKFWDAWLAGTPPRHNNNDEALRDPYLALADQWVRVLFGRALSAHQSGKDLLSVADARRLTAVQPVVEAEAGRRGYRQSPSTGVHEAGQPYFPYLGLLPRLLADEERRVGETAPRPALADIRAMPDKAARIAALIRALDQVAVQQQSEPGRVEPDNSPIVLALIAEGDAAVQPLINTVAGDTRLTRSVGSSRGSHPGAMLSVAGAAFAALVDILHTTEFGPTWQASLSRPEAAAAVQAYWDRYKGVSVAERWYRTLADDKAAPAQWLEAAHEIIRPGDERVRGGWIERGVQRSADVPPQGESLRRGHAPSVSALMARRVTALVTYSGAPDNDSRQSNDVENATTMALYFTAWDPGAARPTLREQFGVQRKTIAFWKGKLDVRDDALKLTRLTLARVQSGDPAALADYMGWLRGTSLQDLPIFSLSEILEPLWRAPGDPAVMQGAAFLFGDPSSPWVPLIQERPGGLYGSEFEKLLESPLLRLAAFRRAMLASLADRAVLNSVTLGGPNRQMDDSEVDPFRPAIPQAFPVRRCDLYAWHLSHLGGMPAFQYDWPLAKKDAAVAAASARLRRYGGSLASDLPPVLPGILPGEGGSPPVSAPILRFPRLDHPATAQDVARNRAIFALGAGARVVPLPDSPLPARWVTDRRYPRDVNVWSVARKKYEPGLGYSQDGNVWQAEETAGGKRFYGFVGPHDIARVPAEQVEFPPVPYIWTQVSEGLDCELIGAPGDPLAPPTGLPRAGPLMLRLRSRRGLAQTIPGDFLRKHLALKLLFSPDDPRAEPREPRDPSRTWEEVQPRRALPQPPARAQRLEPAEDCAAWTLDPHDWYDLTRPGAYRLEFAFAARPTDSGAPSPEAAFRVTR